MCWHEMMNIMIINLLNHLVALKWLWNCQGKLKNLKYIKALKRVALLLLASSLRFSLHKTAAPSENIPAGLENLATDKAQNRRSKWKSIGVTSLQPLLWLKMSLAAVVGLLETTDSVVALQSPVNRKPGDSMSTSGSVDHRNIDSANIR